MAKPAKKSEQKASKKGEQAAFLKASLSFFTDMNRLIMGIGMVVIIIGFYALAQPPLNGYITIHVAPFLLVVGYLVLIPLGIMWREKEKAENKDVKGD